MIENPRALEILLEELTDLAPQVPADLVAKIYRLEERVQFDRDRREAAPQIRDLVQAMLDKQNLKGSQDGHES